AGRRAIAIESGRDVPVADDVRARPPLLGRLLDERSEPAGVVDVAVRVDGGGHWALVDAANELERPGAGAEAAGVDEDEPGRAAHERDVGPRVQEENVGGDLFVPSGDPQNVLQRGALLPEPLGKREDLTHTEPPASA